MWLRYHSASTAIRIKSSGSRQEPFNNTREIHEKN